MAARAGRERTIVEQAYRVVAQKVIRRFGCGRGQAVERNHPLRADAETATRRREHPQPLRPAQDAPEHDAGACKVFEVVDDEQQLMVRDPLDEHIERIAFRGEIDVEPGSQRGDHQLGDRVVVHWWDTGQRHERDVVTLAPAGCGELHAQAGLAAAAGSHDGDQAAGGIVDQPQQAVQLRMPTDEARAGPRQRRHGAVGGGAAADLVGQRSGLLGGPFAQLLEQHVHARVELRQRRRGLTGVGEQPHERPGAPAR